ncbi:MAG: hypothetical protein ACE367_07215 [Acidimicrobiales bacterium]
MNSPVPDSRRSVGAVERLLSAYRSPGPYLSAIVPTEAVSDSSRADTLARRRDELAGLGATEVMLDALAARLAVPAPDDAGGQLVWVAADGTTVADFGQEPPKAPVFRLAELPDAAPALEWAQWRIPHLIVAVTPGFFELAVFPVDDAPSLLQFVALGEALDRCRAVVDELGIELVVIGGDPDQVTALQRELTTMLPPSCIIEPVDADEAPTGDELADATVRRVADLTARRTVDALREFRFLREHGEAVEGAPAVIEALAAGEAELVGPAARLLVHADPADRRLAYFGDGARDVGLEIAPYLLRSARLVDVAIRAALLQGARVRIIPSTADTGPVDDIALTLPRADM